MDNNNNLISSESFNYNPAGNMTIGMDESVVYDTNNRIVEYQGTEVTYDADGNMTGSSLGTFAYDSANRLTVADTTIYTYDVENIRVKKCIGESITEYTHNANSKLSQLLMKTENGVTTYYIYGLGLIYETTETDCKIYHYDYRGSTVALTNLSGDVTDTFTYDTYGKLTARTGTTATPFLYNGRDGVMSDENGLVYMRARYYSPTFKRFINADVVAGSITNAITLNRYAYANGNPVSNVDPFGLCARDTKPHLYDQDGGIIYPKGWLKKETNKAKSDSQAIQPPKYESTHNNGSVKVDSKRKELDWSKATLEEMWLDTLFYIVEESKVGENEYALHDNYRNQPDGVFHEQFFIIKTGNGVSASANLSDINELLENPLKNTALCGDYKSWAFEFSTGEWNFKNWSIGIFNFIEFKYTEGITSNNLFILPNVGVKISIWNPDFTINVGDKRINVEIDVGSIELGTASYFLDKLLSQKSSPSQLIGIEFSIEDLE